MGKLEILEVSPYMQDMGRKEYPNLKKQKVIFLSPVNFIKQYAKELYVNAVEEKYEVELWDLSIAYGTWRDMDSNEPLAQLVKSFDEFELKIAEQQERDYRLIFIIDLSEPIRLKPIAPICARKNVPMVNLSKETLGRWLTEQGWWQYRKYYPWKTRIHARLLHNPVYKWGVNYFRKDGGYQFDYQMASVNCYPKSNRTFLKIHHIKYDEYKMYEDCDRLIGQPYALFIDCGASTHSMYDGLRDRLDHGEYMNYLLKWLEDFEKTSGLEVVVSLHPRSSYKEGEFGDRKVYTGRTPELIRHAEFVLAHYSTSLFTAILMDKPICVIYYEEMFASAFRGSLVMGLKLAELCGAQVCERKQPFEMKGHDEEKYRSFLDEYVLNGDALDKSNGELIQGYLENIFEEWDWNR